MDGPSFHGWLLIDFDRFAQDFKDLFEHVFASVLMHHFPTSKSHSDLALVPGAQKPPDMLQLGLEIVLIGLGAKLDLLELDRSLLFAPILLLFLQLILVLSKIHDPANRRHCIRSHFHQVDSLTFGVLQSFGQGQNSHLATVDTDDPDFLRPDLLIATGIFN